MSMPEFSLHNGAVLHVLEVAFSAKRETKRGTEIYLGGLRIRRVHAGFSRLKI
jgi:hypothetical protein